jgi:hypothetical protein
MPASGQNLEGTMRSRFSAWTLAAVAGATLMASSGPAAAAWRGYISHPLGFAFAAPGDLKFEKGKYQAAVAGAHDTMVWRSVDDGIEYRVIVIDTTAEANKAATLLGEAEYIFQDQKKLLMDAFGRVDGKYGRKLTIDLPNKGGRTTAAFWFVNGRIVSLQAHVPADGDVDTPEMARFVDSITFYPVRAADDALELPLPK